MQGGIPVSLSTQKLIIIQNYIITKVNQTIKTEHTLLCVTLVFLTDIAEKCQFQAVSS